MIKYSIIMCIYTLWSNKTYTNFFDSPMVNLPPSVLVPGIKNSVAKCYPWTSPIIPGEWCYSRFSLASLSLNFTTPTWELTFKSRRWLLREGMCRAPGHESKKWWHYVGEPGLLMRLYQSQQSACLVPTSLLTCPLQRAPPLQVKPWAS